VEVIVDEAHFLKNSRSVLFKKTQTMSQGHYCQMLTGTPTSKPLDCYSYIKIKSPKLYRSYTHFEALHVGERDFWKTPISFINLDLLRDNFALRSISRTKKEVHGYSLVPLFPDTSYDLTVEHKKVYDKLVEEQLLLFSDGSKIDATTPAKLRHALQQAVINFDHFSNNADNRSAFYDILDQTIEETECDQLGKSKLIIWTKYKMTSAKLWEYCKKRGIKTVAAYSESNASEAAEAFMHDETTRILVANPQSAGAGLNPQYVCSEALFAEIDTVPIYARQAIGRIDRTGQKVPPRIKIAVARGTVQEWLFHDLMRNDDQVARIEPTKDGLRRMLMGQY
jgi:SNF2 family DNA or RNA helicase